MTSQRRTYALLLLLVLGLCPVALAQAKLDEARETLRFVRLAETKRQLKMSDKKLLELNELLDTFEDTRFQYRKREMQIGKTLGKTSISDGEANKVLDEMVALHRDMENLEIKLIEDVRQMLTPSETTRFFKFYEQFQRDMFRRIRNLQEQRKGDDRDDENDFRPGDDRPPPRAGQPPRHRPGGGPGGGPGRQ